MRHIISLFIVMILPLLIGCASVRAARLAQDPKNIPPGERTVQAAEVGLTEKSTLTLSRALEIARQCHPSIVRARQSFIVVEKQFADAMAGYFPDINISAGSRYEDSASQTSSSDDGKIDKSYSAGVSLSQLIYDFGKTPASIRAAYENKLASEANLRATENTLVYNVRNGYYELLKQIALVKVAEETVKQYEVHLEQTKTLAEVGRRIKYDITKTEVDLGNAKISLVNSRNALTTARAVLNNAMGLTEVPEYAVEEPPLEKFAYQFDELVRTAYENHPDLAGALARERASSAAVDQSIATLFPSLSLSGNYGWSGREFPLVWSWTAGGLVSYLLSFNVFSGFQPSVEIDKAVANLRSARASRAETEQRIYLDLKQAAAQLEDARERFSLTELLVKQAEENLHLVEERYRIGKASTVELTDARVSLTNARVNQIKARADYQTAVALIRKTIGLGEK